MVPFTKFARILEHLTINLLLFPSGYQGFFSRRKFSDKSENRVSRWGPIFWFTPQNFRLFSIWSRATAPRAGLRDCGTAPGRPLECWDAGSLGRRDTGLLAPVPRPRWHQLPRRTEPAAQHCLTKLETTREGEPLGFQPCLPIPAKFSLLDCLEVIYVIPCTK